MPGNTLQSPSLRFYISHSNLGSRRLTIFKKDMASLRHNRLSPENDLSSKIVPNSIKILLIVHDFTKRFVEHCVFQIIKNVGSEFLVFKHWIRPSIVRPFLCYFPPTKSKQEEKSQYLYRVYNIQMERNLLTLPQGLNFSD